MPKIIIVALATFAISLIPHTKARSAENMLLGAFDQPSASQLMLTALAEPGSPQVGKTVQVTDELRFVVGYRLWLNYWQTSIAKVQNSIPDPDIPTQNIQIVNQGAGPTINQFAAASIPGVGVRYKDFFASASVMISPDYNFPKTSEIVSGFLDPTVNRFFHEFRVDHRIVGSRIETDINMGYYIHPWIALTMGYKGVFQKFKEKGSALDLTTLQSGGCATTSQCTAQISGKSNPNYNGGTLGIAANIPIPEGGIIGSGFSLYGNGGGGPSASSDFKIAWYGTVDAGLAYKAPSWPLLFTIGYKFQIINSLTKSGAPTNHIIDYTRGAILGINFVF